MPVIPEDGRDAAQQVLVPVPSSAERRSLRARAHALDPVVRIGDAGLTDAVVAETDRALAAHGLIKVRVAGEDRSDREAAAATFERRLGCAVVQSIGKVLVLWRPRPDEGVDAAPARATPRRRVAPAPKKLAALGKPAPARKSRPAPAPRGADAAPAKRRGPPPPGTHPVGPGIRTTRGALDTSARPAGAGRGASNSAGARSTTSPARPSTSRAPARSGAGPRGTPSPARPATGTRSATGARSTTGTRSATGARPATGARAPASGSAPRPTSSAPPARRPRPAPDADSTAAGRKSGAPAKTSAARPASTRATPATGSARPGPRTRAGRREP